MEETIDKKKAEVMGEFMDALYEASKQLPAHEIGFRMVSTAVDIILRLSPNEMMAMKKITSAIKVGIEAYQNDNCCVDGFRI